MGGQDKALRKVWRWSPTVLWGKAPCPNPRVEASVGVRVKGLVGFVVPCFCISGLFV